MHEALTAARTLPAVDAIVGLVDSAVRSYSHTLLALAVQGERREVRNLRHEGEFLSEIDLELDSYYRARVPGILGPCIYASEEADVETLSCDDEAALEYVVIVDPLDTSELAVRGLCGYTHVVVYSLPLNRPVVAVIGDMFHSVEIFCAYRDDSGKDRAFLQTREGTRHDIRSSRETRLHRALVTNYSMRPQERFARLAQEKGLLQALGEADQTGQHRGRIGVDFGSMALCHVAAGFTDAVVEMAKGFALWDLYPGQYLLEAAGGVVTDLDGKRLPLNLSFTHLDKIKDAMNGRQKFVAAGNPTLLRQIVDSLAAGL